MTQTVLILGTTGRIGRHAAQAFEAAGWSVRGFDRKTERMIDAAKGCDVIVNGLNPPNYHDWGTLLPQITRDVIEAAKASGATVILPGNVYHFGDKGGVWSEATVPAPVSGKGQTRLDIERMYAASGVQTIVLRAGNFIDPDLQGCVMGAVYLRRLSSGKVVLPGPPTTRQAMCYLPDWARAAVALADMRGQLSTFEDIPFKGHTMTAQQLKDGLEQVMNRRLKFVGFPWWIMALAAPFWELARELREMRYLWNTDHELSDERLSTLLPAFKVTPLEDVLATLVRT